VIVVLGVFAVVGERYPWFKLGRLPGDIVYEKDNTKVFVPITSMIVVSLAISLGFVLLRVLKR
jgi:Protein of unknown function (DUF2905)